MIRVTLTGMKELEKNLFRLKRSTARANVRAAAVEALEPMARDMRTKAPKDTLALSESINVGGTPKPPLPKQDAFEIAVGPGRHPQAIIQEFGSYKEPAQPYARPAWEANKRSALDRFGALLWARVEGALERVAVRRRRGG